MKPVDTFGQSIVLRGSAQKRRRIGPARLCEGGGPPNLRRFLLLAVVGLACLAVVSDAFAVDKERLIRLKAAFIFNIIGYVRWPESAQDNITVGILGEDPVAVPLRAISKKRMVKGKRMEVKVFPEASGIGPCNILFVSAPHVAALDSLGVQLESSHVLLIGDTDGLAGKGVAVNFVVVKERLRFEVSLQALKRAGLVVGAKMLNLSILVDEKDSQ
jgi:hypothetical protein